MTSLLTEELVARDVDVTLLATQDSITSPRLAAVILTPYSEDDSSDPPSLETRHAACSACRCKMEQSVMDAHIIPSAVDTVAG